MTDGVIRFLTSWARLTRAIEGVLVDNLAATSPWLAPLLPAYMAYDAMLTSLHFPPWVAFAGAAVVEFLGLSGVATTFQLWDYNDRRRKPDQAAPVHVALLAAAFYLTVIVTVNVMLDDAPALHKAAKALLSLLSVIAAVILALRAQHSRRLLSIEQDRQEKKDARQLAAQDKQPSGKLPAVSDWRKLGEAERLEVKTMSAVEIASRYNVSERTARNWRKNGRGK